MILVQLLFLSHMAFANGNAVGNGGNSGFCPAGATSVELANRWIALDLLETNYHRGFHYSRLARLQKLPLKTAYAQALKMFFSRYPAMREQLRVDFAAFNKQATFYRELPDFSTGSVLGGSCQITQAMIQYTPSNLHPAHRIDLRVSLTAWNNMRTDQKVALLIHEYLMHARFFVEGFCVTNEIRELVGFALSDEGLSASKDTWMTVMDSHCDRFPTAN